MRKKLQRLGLYSRSDRNADLTLASRMVPALAFVREEDLNDFISKLAPPLPDELMPLLNEFVINQLIP